MEDVVKVTVPGCHRGHDLKERVKKEMGPVPGQHVRHYRLVDQQGAPHPVLDGLYESLDAAWNEALGWWHQQFSGVKGPVEIGVEVSTASGIWRTLRFPGS